MLSGQCPLHRIDRRRFHVKAGLHHAALPAHRRRRFWPPTRPPPALCRRAPPASTTPRPPLPGRCAPSGAASRSMTPPHDVSGGPTASTGASGTGKTRTMDKLAEKLLSGAISDGSTVKVQGWQGGLKIEAGSD